MAVPIEHRKIFARWHHLLQQHPELFVTGVIRETDQPDQLLIDYDGKPWTLPEVYNELRFLGLKPVAIYYARSNNLKHWHVVIKLDRKIPRLARVCAQLFLGSDEWRERQNFVKMVHHKRTDKYVNVLFGRKL